MLAGVCGGYLVMKLLLGAEAHAGGMIIGAILASLVTISLVSFVSRLSRIKEDTAIGIMYTGIFAAGVVLVSLLQKYIHIDIYHFIIGDILGIGDADLWVAAVVGAVVLSGVILAYRQLQLASFDRITAAAIGLPVLLLDYLLTTGVSLVVVSGVRMVGVVMVVGLLVSPAASAYLLCNRLWTMMLVAAGFGVTGVIGGMYLASWIGSSGGGAIILFVTLQFMLVLCVAPHHGLLARWWRLRHQLPQQLVEDVLSSILRAPGDRPAVVAIQDQMPSDKGQVARVLERLRRQGLVDRAPGGWALSASGQLEATRLRRAHRLWESYLKQVGVPDEELHARADRLEHVNDPQVLDYIDDLLGHPVHDPHGSEIPAAVLALDPDRPVPVSLLREGHEGEVAMLAPAARSLDLALGERVVVAPRQDEGRVWVLQREDEGELRLDHDTADAVLLRLDPQAVGTPPSASPA